MLDLVKYLNARLAEPATWASIAMLLGLAHVSVDPGLWSTITAYGVIGAGLLGIVLREAGNKPTTQIAVDVVETLAAAIRAAKPADVNVAPGPVAAAEPAIPAPAAPAAA